ncbi:FHA domain-containing protein [Mycobacterium intracellulare]|uniref:ABC transporter ATP-binding protein n=12 Tax=Mycobacterium intracellulare TaxID=1767 RepID=A0A1Y0TB77_MYCIT|nr:FHA domain-containing protein [Mycobacterium intracellulare]ARV85282.1 ABC transporter ATP-binding protein [Mycobacterium intracellulare subsp. chimaera]ASL11257.1 ABC transporter ATP-binding protein [Mycobacterium intracellulare subsp. chimaera]ASL17134.1 ABC transporter ATP-binding protein [Mycobacterium intracellulare subsp. chimaera]ASL23180.1 ABC transporter ATP-binding protein [Mycobacterium intracellulare subsp. chimaera]MCA2350790.1 ATP-binding cassette domain-containing protein [My
MSAPAPPALTVHHEGSERTFAAGHDVVVGRDLRADMRITHPLISRAHLLLRFDQGKWLAIDNGSLNGTFVNGRRVPVVEIHDGQTLNIGNPDGPLLTFDVGRHQGMAGRPPKTESMNIPVAAPPQPAAWSAQPGPPVAAPPGPPPPPAGRTPNWAAPPRRPQPAPRPGPAGQTMYGAGGGRPPAYPPAAPPPPHNSPLQAPVHSPPPVQHIPAPTRAAPANAKPPEVANLATKMFQALLPSRSGAIQKPAGSQTIGRATDNDIVIQDVLASRHHAFLIQTPLGTEIRDAHSVNGTFVNGVRVGSAVLTEGDVVTIGNVDLVFTGDGLVRRTEAATRTGGLEVNSVCYTVDHGKQLLDNISVTARPGTLTAIIGGSGAGKTTLSRLIVGYTSPTSGTVTFEGHNIHTEYASMRSRIGMVPQDDVVHRQLTVNQALNYAAELRLPPDTSKEERARVVAQVLEELDMTQHAETRVDKLSGGQRKRASVALELLTQPSLLLLDEPTSGLDPALDRQVMLMLRQLADAGRVVLVVTHSVSYLDVCDQILLVAPGGKTAFCGPPDQVEPAMGTRNWADIFAKVGADPDEANRRFKERNQQSSQPPTPQSPADLGEPPQTNLWRQLSTIARRQVRLVVSDRGYTIFLAILPFLIGALSLTVKGPHPGLGPADPMGPAPTQPQYIMVLLNIGAVFMGTALTIRDLIGERAIFKREQAVGLSTTAYLLAKIAVFCVFATGQAAIATIIVRLGKGAPTAHPQFFGNSTFSLFVTVAGTCVASAMLGLLLSALAQSNEQIMPLLVVSIMSQLVFSSGMIPVYQRIGLEQLAWLTPARWGYAAGASSIDFPSLVKVKQIPTNDPIWQHSKHIFVFDMAMLTLLSIAYTGIVRWHIRLKR